MINNKLQNPERITNASLRATPSLSIAHYYIRALTTTKSDPRPCTITHPLGVVAVLRHAQDNVWQLKLLHVANCPTKYGEYCQIIFPRIGSRQQNLHRQEIIDTTVTSLSHGVTWTRDNRHNCFLPCHTESRGQETIDTAVSSLSYGVTWTRDNRHNCVLPVIRSYVDKRQSTQLCPPCHTERLGK